MIEIRIQTALLIAVLLLAFLGDASATVPLGTGYIDMAQWLQAIEANATRPVFLLAIAATTLLVAISFLMKKSERLSIGLAFASYIIVGGVFIFCESYITDKSTLAWVRPTFYLNTATLIVFIVAGQSSFVRFLYACCAAVMSVVAYKLLFWA
jgi:prolipoprotein diacylglyceryltransferase